MINKNLIIQRKMRIEIPQIFWHGNRDRIMSIDFYPNSNLLITSGAESENKMFVKLWRIEEVTLDELANPALSIGQNQQNLSSIQSPFDDNQNGNFSSNNQNYNLLQTLTDPENTSNSRIKPIFECELNGAHISTVNVCRFSPNGKYLATGSDDNTVIIWVQKSRPTNFGSSEEKVCWSNYKILRGHSGDVYDLSWNPESKYLISGSVDNYCMIWNIEKAKCVNRFMDHDHFVQGVSWDPRNKYILTQSSDKSVRFYKNTYSKLEMKFIYINQLKRFEIKNNNNKNNNMQNNSNNNPISDNNQDNEIQKQDISTNKMQIEEEQNIPKNNDTNNNNPINQNNQLNNQSQPKKDKEKSNEKEKDTSQKNVLAYHYYFADEDQCNTFVRRSSFSPDGKICLLVSGVMQNPKDKNELEFVVWGVSRKDFSRPKFYIPTLNKSSTCVRFCPLIFHKREEENDNNVPALLDLNYVMIFAIGTNDSVFIYGTDSIQPRYALTNIHYQSITDLAWNGDKMLAISSSDGYISFVVFEENELGIPYRPEDITWDDEKFKKQYQLYFDVDINKNVMSNTQNIITDIKIKKKKNISNADNTINNNIERNINSNQDKNNNINEINEVKDEDENKNNVINMEKSNMEENKEEKKDIDKMEIENH